MHMNSYAYECIYFVVFSMPFSEEAIKRNVSVHLKANPRIAIVYSQPDIASKSDCGNKGRSLNLPKNDIISYRLTVVHVRIIGVFTRNTPCIRVGASSIFFHTG